MILSKVYIAGFRNFKEVTVNFNEHSLIIGANDVGKTNLIYALRILLDRGFSDYDFELKESDFYAYEDTKAITIKAFLSNITEDCVVARMRGKLSDDGDLVLQYKAELDNGKVSYKFFCGKSDTEEDLKEIDSPYYRKYLNLKYISSRREFWGYINKTKNDLLLQAKGDRSAENVEIDDRLYAEIEEKLKEVDDKIPQLSYVKNATDHLNEELNKLSIHNNEQQIVFDVASTDVDRVITNVSVTSKHGEKKMLIGGEGRINQIYLSLWASQNQHTDISNEISIIVIEEPEAYLHPHQQRELAAYLGRTLQGQVILTSHSPYVVNEFSPNSIIRLYKKTSNNTLVASNGCSEVIEEGFEDFGYRMSVIPAEAFFSDYVILVEGPSELILYKTLAKQIEINLDRLNVSVMSAEGVGFKTYIKILDALEIEWVLRTDNDIMKIPNVDGYRYAGVERGLSFLEQSYEIEADDRAIIDANKGKIHGFPNKDNIAEDVKTSANSLIEILGKYDILLATIGLEEDLFYSPIKKTLKEYYGEELTDQEIISKMKAKKAINMYDFLKSKKAILKELKDDAIAEPLRRAKKHIEEMYGTY
jgi:putative ATP-dependent endonuclease of OLD family